MMTWAHPRKIAVHGRASQDSGRPSIVKSAWFALAFLAAVFPKAAIADPPSVPTDGLALWARADAGVTTDGSGNVSTWADQSAAHNDLSQASASARPLLVPDAVNGLPVLRFDGSDDFVNFTTRLTTIRTVFWVVKKDTAATTAARFLLGDTSTWHFHSDLDTIWHSTYTSASIKNGQTFVNGEAVDGTTTLMPTTPSVVSLVTTGNVTAANFSLDRNGTTTVETWWGDLAELVIYNRVLSAAERASVEAYLIAKYQIGATVTAPVIAPNGGLFTDSVSVSISTATAGADIRYTLDGSEPSASSSVYTEPFAVVATTTVKAKAFKDGLTASTTTTAGFTRDTDLTPASVSGLKLWLRADAGVASAWGDFWADQSGSGNHAIQPTGVALPRLAPNVVNGLPVLRFDGSNDFVKFTTRLTTIRTVFWVMKKDAAATTAARFLLGDTSTWHFHSDLDTIWHPSYTSAYVRNGQTFVNGEAVDGTTTLMPTTPSVVSLVTTGNVTAANFSLDRNGTTTVETWWGDLAELVIYDRPLTTSEREAVEGYLQIKYALGSELPAPMISPGTGTYSADQTVTISATSGATIRYTTDGTDPTETSAVYSAPLTVTESRTIKARAYQESFQASAVSAATYTMKVANPALSVPGGTYNTPQSVTVTCATAGADIHYTTNGVEPTQADATIASGGTLSISDPTTLKVRAWRAGWTASDVLTTTYSFKVATPTLTPAAGSYVGALPVTVSTSSPGATLHYSLDGDEVTETDPVVASGSAVTVARSATLKVRGWRTGWVPSDPVMGTYWIGLGTVATPALFPVPGTYTGAQNVTASSVTEGAVIRYTTDGTEPGFASPIYAGPIVVSSTTDLKVRAFAPDMTGSTSAGGLYVIDLGTVDQPRLSPMPGDYPTQQWVTVRSETPDAVIHYRTDGLDPDESDPVVASGATVLVDQPTHFKARAFKAGTPASGVASGDYRITGAVATLDNGTVALKADGTVWGSGRNQYGSLGLAGNGQEITTPGQIQGISDVVAVAGGAYHVVALKRDMTVWAWGRNYQGELGNGNTTQSSTPVRAGTLTAVIAIAAGEHSSLALKSDGTVWRWGANHYASGYVTTPTQVPGIHGVARIGTGSELFLAIQNDGTSTSTLWAWGDNAFGQIGDGTKINRATPVGIATDVVAVAGGWIHAYAIRTDGTLIAWGHNNFYQLGDGTTNEALRPIAVAGLTGITSVTGGWHFGLALKSDRTVWGWGSNSYGCLGDSTWVHPRSSPVQSWVVDALSVAAFGFGKHAAAVKADGSLWTWGKNDVGALGDGTTNSNPTPKPVPGFTLVANTLWTVDTDGDGLTNMEESALGTDGRKADTNGDGIPDGAALRAGISATNPDMDGDGALNTVEAAQGTDPFVADTDGDGVPDGVDAFPLDPSRWQAPAPDPNDVTPPAITLQEPTNASLVSSIPPQ
jgi:alpha-tubulin suppressor-like RCC1 family protein